MFTTTEYQQRIINLKARLQQTGLDAMIVSTDPNLTYLTGVSVFSMERPVVMVIPAEGPTRLVLPRMEQEPLGESPTVDHHHVYWELDANPGRGWVETLQQAIGPAKNLGVDPFAELTLTTALSDYHWQISPLVEDLRVIKSPAEIALTRRAANYWTQAMNDMLAIAKAGTPVGELMAVGGKIAQAVFDHEPAANWINTNVVQFFQCAPLSGSPHHLSYRADEVLPDGPSIINAVGALCHYNAENERTILTGQYTAQYAELFDLVTQGQQLALDLIKPGVRCADVDSAVQEFFIKEGVGDSMRHRIGHGFGIEPHERPFISEGSEEVFQSNMMISVEPGLYVDGVGGFRHSDTVLITETGIENLTTGTPTDRKKLTF